MSKNTVDEVFDTEGYGYNVKYEHEVSLDDTGVPYKIIDWCSENIKNRWGWYFTSNQIAIMTFEDSKEALWFAMTMRQ